MPVSAAGFPDGQHLMPRDDTDSASAQVKDNVFSALSARFHLAVRRSVYLLNILIAQTPEAKHKCYMSYEYLEK